MVDNQAEWIFEGREKMRSRKIDREGKEEHAESIYGDLKGLPGCISVHEDYTSKCYPHIV